MSKKFLLLKKNNNMNKRLLKNKLLLYKDIINQKDNKLTNLKKLLK